MNLSSLDMIFIATNVSLHEYSGNAERDLSRYEFLEILVRLAIGKYGSTMEPHKALEELLDKHVYKFCNPHDIVNFRMKMVFTRGIDEYIKRNEPYIRKFFNKFLHGVKNYFTCKDALEMCLKVKLKIADKSITYAYSCAKQSVVDPLKDPTLPQKMYFPEFIVCLCGIAFEYFKDGQKDDRDLSMEQKLHKVLQELQKYVE
jgi:hypothetical protein